MTVRRPPIPLSSFQIVDSVRAALREDRVDEDIPSHVIIPANMHATAHIIAQEQLVVAGLQIAQTVFREIDQTLRITLRKRDGDQARANDVLLRVTGSARSILMGERVALNFLQHLSGIATLTAKFCKIARAYGVKIVDTRKTVPGLRHFQKWAVRLGGGTNHRSSLGDGILIKDNHLSLLQTKKIGIADACRKAREQSPPGLRVEVEVETLAQVREALRGKADVIMLDNMHPALIRQAVTLIKGRAAVEVSGGVTLGNVREIAATGVDYISVGALTHSAPAANIHLELVHDRRGLSSA